MIPPPPAQLRIEQRQGYCVVRDERGELVAQGTECMCELVAARRPIFIQPGDLFDAE